VTSDEDEAESEPEPSSEDGSPVKSGIKRKRKENSGPKKKPNLIKPVSTPVRCMGIKKNLF